MRAWVAFFPLCQFAEESWEPRLAVVDPHLVLGKSWCVQSLLDDFVSESWFKGAEFPTTRVRPMG